ncbi:molybdenum cofactor guanylyltransferase [Salibacterium aidingense]|uniref:molybdenum cofactor guanylyltransferase n=1 Tax=Salibacterium aidingense TaxID=384933 RepID=UPI0003FCF99F|nr:molybdenum cofactor guanylyltransferase [Salibacterium aidingense]
MNIAGVVLCGGKSERYQKQKIFETYKGSPFYSYSAAALQQGGIRDVYLQTNRTMAAALSSAGFPLLLEEKEHEGPLYALAAAMRQLNNKDWIFLLPADVPYVRSCFVSSVLEYVWNAAETADAWIPSERDQLHPLHGLYHTGCLPVMEELLHQNKKSMHPLLKKVHTAFIPYSIDQRDFININRQEDWL